MTTDTQKVEITRDEDGVKIVEYSATQAALAKLEEDYKDVVFEVATTKGMTQAKDARKRLRGLRTGLEKRRQDLKAPILEYTRALDGQAKEITARITALEDPIDQQVKAEEQRKAREKAEAEAAERRRIDAHRQVIEAMRNKPLAMIGKPAAELHEAFTAIQAADLSELEEFQTEAALVKDEAAGKLHELYTQAKHAEEAQAREDAARIEREKAEEEARQAREAQEAEEKAKRDAELKELEELRAFKAKQQAAQEAENQAARESLDKVAMDAFAHGRGTMEVSDHGIRHVAQEEMAAQVGVDHGTDNDLVYIRHNGDLAYNDYDAARDSLVEAMEGALNQEQASQIIDEIIAGNITHVTYIGTPSLEVVS